MKEETKLELIKLSMQLTADLMKDKAGHLNKLTHAKGLGRTADPLAIFDVIYAHLSETITKE